MSRKGYSREEVEYCRVNLRKMGWRGLAVMLNSKWGRNTTAKSLQKRMIHYGVTSNKQGSQLCWWCQNAVPTVEHGCPWSEKAEPVPGWDAEETVLYLEANGRQTELKSFRILACPMFEEEEPRVPEWMLDDED